MKRLILSFTGILMLTGSMIAQENIILTFSAVNGTTSVPVDQVWIRNVTKQCDTLLPPEGSTINLGPVGINEFTPAESNRLSVQATPNPVEHQSDIRLYMPIDGQLDILISTSTGQSCLTYSRYLNAGNHQFRFFPGKAAMYTISFRVGSLAGYLKMVNMGHGSQECRLDYITFTEPGDEILKKTETRGFVFLPGDELLISCISGDEQSGMILAPTNAQLVVFQFASGVPCPGLETVTYEGKVYNTVQIFGQCWLKENLDIGIMINGSVEQSDNGVIEKYCFQDDPANCEEYGGMYQWSEMMQYINEDEHHRGICPGDWHLPTDMEWMILEGSVDSQYGIGDEFWYHDGNRGFDAGKNLKATEGYQNNGNGTDLYGFAGLPGGVHHDDGSYIGKTKYAVFWTGTRSISVFCSTYRFLDYYYDLIYRDTPDRSDAMSVRCIKD